MTDEHQPNSFSTARRYAIMTTVMLGSTLYATALLTTSTILPQMQGALSATQDEIAWVMTFNILATAVSTPLTGWLVARFGKRAVMLWSMLGFSLATLMCGFSQSLEMLVVWRILQGALGAPTVPMSQTILLDTFPRSQHGMVMSIFGMTVVIGPVIGPILGGWLVETYSWRWSFYMIVPVGLLTQQRRRTELDWTGFLALSTAMAALQLVLARGQRLDWFESTEILVEIVVAALAFYVFLAHSLTAKQPFLNLKLLRDRNYALGLMLVTIYGMLNFTPMVLLPPLLQQHVGFPDTLVGQVIGWRGVGAAIGFLLALPMGRLDPRLSMGIGFALQVVSGYGLLQIDLNVGMSELIWNSLLQGIAVGVIWVPLTQITFETVDPAFRAEATAIYHLLRNIGSSFFISLCVAQIVRTTSANYSRMSEQITPLNPVISQPWATGGWVLDTVPGLARFGREVARQAAMIGYLNAFTMYTAASALAIALILLVKRNKAGLA
jgi:MFS transporter, DHA2 family, multidrug resistance protein